MRQQEKLLRDIMLNAPDILGKVNPELELRRIQMYDFDKVVLTIRLWEQNDRGIPVGHIHHTVTVWKPEHVEQLECEIAAANDEMLATMQGRGTTTASSEQIEEAMAAELERLRSVSPPGVPNLVNREGFNIALRDWD